MSNDLFNSHGGSDNDHLSPEERKEIKEFLLKTKQIDSRLHTVEEKVAKTDRNVRDIQEEYTLLPAECDQLSKAVRSKGVDIMGGKKKPAYKNNELRQKLYLDIYLEVKRQYGLIDDSGRQKPYKTLPRKYLKGALEVVNNYVPPIALQNEVDAENEIGDM